MTKRKNLIIALLIIIAFSFYWFDIRHSNIRKDCISSMIETGKTYTVDSDSAAGMDIAYRICLYKHGLKE